MAGQAVAKEKSKGGILGNIGNSLFKQVKDVIIDLQTGTMGVKQKNDEAGDVLATVDAEGELVHNPIKQLGLPIPGIAIRTPVADLKPGDIIVMPDGGYSFNLGPTEEGGNLKIVNAKSGRATNFNPAKNTLLGNNGVLAVRNIFNLGGGGGAGGLFGNPLMLMLLLGNKDGDDDGGLGGLDKKTLMLLMLSGGLGGQPAEGGAGGLFSNPLMLLLLLGNKDDEDEGDGLFGGGGLNTLLMMQMMGGGCGGGLFGGLGGGTAAKKPCCKHTEAAVN